MGKCPSKKVIDQMKKGSKKVTYCGRKYSQDGKIIKRDGEQVCAEYFREDIPKECFN